MIKYIDIRDIRFDYENNSHGLISMFNNNTTKIKIGLSCIVDLNAMQLYDGPKSVINDVSEYLAKEGRLSNECLGELISDKLNCKLTFKEIQQAIEHTFPEKLY